MCELLPRDGCLNLFYDPVAAPADYAFPHAHDPVLDTAPDQGWRVIHAGASAVDVPAPDGATVYLERVMRRTHTLPWIGMEDFPKDIDDQKLSVMDAWEDMGAPVFPPCLAGRDNPNHFVGGWPIWLQSSIWDTPDWRLLLELDTDDELGWCWGDAGRLYFGITERDLRAGNFDRVWVVSESH